jgi:DNA modification methylase
MVLPTTPAKVAPSLEPLLRLVHDLRPDPENTRTHPERNLAAIRESLERFGQQKPIVIAPDGTVVAGSGTLEAARSLGWSHIACVTTDLAGPEARGFAIADNRTAELAQWDVARLAAELDVLPRDLVAQVGFDDQDLRKIAHQAELAIRALADAGLLDEVPAPPEEATTKPGDLIVLGRHRLLCGDAADEEALDRLLAGTQIHLVNTDPPYNVKVEPRSNNAIAAGISSFASYGQHHQGFDLARHPEKAKATHARLRAKDRPLANDFLPEEEFAALLRRWFKNMARVLMPGRAFYVWGGFSNLANYPPALKDSGLYFSQSIVWDKQHPVLTRKDFMTAHEQSFYGWKEGAAHVFYGPNNVPDLWPVKKLNHTAMTHLTEKPVELAVRAITYSTVPGENVLDLFGGSGSTLIAAETTNRTAYLMELDPLYCDVIAARYERVTGKVAERVP